MDRDRVGKSVWEAGWVRSAVPDAAFDPEGAPGIRNHFNRSFGAALRERLVGHVAVGAAPRDGACRPTLLEVGCARSVWLPYFGRSLGFDVHGLDYSEVGCQQARALLAASGVPGEVTCADLFAPPDSLLDRFDVVFSGGVVEHFDDTAGCLRAVTRMLRPGGMALTVVPNMTGPLGLIQRVLDRSVYDMHVPLDAEALAEAHRAAGLVGVSSEYLLFANTGILNTDELPPSILTTAKRALLLRPLAALTLALWSVEEAGVSLPPNRWSSPYVICTARKPVRA
jgi:2-polyprenyl-3-methyl-5-hydroxy-6-metoxy-1,4-benzoquinol methylase